MFGLFDHDPAERKRQKLLQLDLPDPLRQYMQTPLADPKQSLYNTEFLSVDFETTGLDAKQDSILSIGFTQLKLARVRMHDNQHHLIDPKQAISSTSVTIHQITDDQAEQGEALENVIPILLHALAGKVMLVHFQHIEKGFLHAACRRLYGHAPPLRIVDTLELARRRMQNVLIGPHHLRLFNLREQYGLPRYHAHSALEDAIGTAELFLAMYANQFEPDNKEPLKHLLHK